MSRALIILGLAIAAVGLLWPWKARLGLGRLPGDIFIQRDNFTFYAPITPGIRELRSRNKAKLQRGNSEPLRCILIRKRIGNERP